MCDIAADVAGCKRWSVSLLPPRSRERHPVTHWEPAVCQAEIPEITRRDSRCPTIHWGERLSCGSVGLRRPIWQSGSSMAGSYKARIWLEDSRRKKQSFVFS